MFVTFGKDANTFQNAVDAHRAGRLPEAEQLYRQILAQNPQHAEALHMLGLLAHQVGQSATGIQMIEQAIRIAPNAPMLSNLAEIMRANNRMADAEALCRQAIAAQPNLAAAYTNLAMIMQQSGRLQEAHTTAMRSVELGPNEVAGYNAVAITLLELGRPQEAIPYFEKSLRMNDQDPMIWSAAGIALERLEQFEKALQCQQKAVALAPNNPRILLHMGCLLARIEKFGESAKYFQAAYEKDPNMLIALEHLAGAKMSTRDFEESINLCRKHFELAPTSVDAYPTLGEALMGIGKFDECIEEMKKGIAKKPTAPIYQTWSNALVRDGKPAEGLEVLEKALAIEPQNPILHFNKSIILLIMGRYLEAWPEYEWRWQHPRMGWRNRAFNRPRWDGSPLNGQRILLHAEQGMGDTIFFGRYITLVAEKGGFPVVFAQTSMVDLVKSIKGVGEVIGEGVQLPAFDVHMPLMSLPGVFNHGPDDVPSTFPYVSSNPEKKAYWEKEFDRIAGKKLKVGLVWEGGNFQPENFLRSASLAAYAPLAEVEGVHFFGLQKGDAEVQCNNPPAGMAFTNLAPHIKDFSDTAAMLDALDLLISIDTSVVHVAAALAKPVWMMLAYSPGHMWMLDRKDSPWYPGMRIWRQPKFKDWTTPVNEIKAELKKYVADHKQKN